jgi:hypothetical protein
MREAEDLHLPESQGFHLGERCGYSIQDETDAVNGSAGGRAFFLFPSIDTEARMPAARVTRPDNDG